MEKRRSDWRFDKTTAPGFGRIILPGTIRSKKNSKQPVPLPAKSATTRIKALIGNRWRYARITLQPSAAYRKWEKGARMEARVQYRMSALTCRLHVMVIAYYKGRRPDLSGAMESVGDCLEGIVWEDDRQIESWDGSRLVHDLKNPRTEIYFRPFGV